MSIDECIEELEKSGLKFFVEDGPDRLTTLGALSFHSGARCCSNMLGGSTTWSSTETRIMSSRRMGDLQEGLSDDVSDCHIRPGTSSLGTRDRQTEGLPRRNHAPSTVDA